MSDQADIPRLFQADKLAGFDFSQAPALVRKAKSAVGETDALEGVDMSRWGRVQRAFLDRTKDKGMYSVENMRSYVPSLESFFQKRGLLEGDVLDLGGGWGLYRQWWEAGESDVFVVHDPGVERFLRGAHETHYRNFPRAFGLPMTFVEGLGEDLPYRNDAFDTCVIAATLDHCADPQKVLAEAHRCVKPGGCLLLLQDSVTLGRRGRRGSIVRRILRRARHPRRSLIGIYNRLFGPPAHMHHFAVAGLVSLLARVGFQNVRSSGDPVFGSVYAFEANK